jgi:putative ABC transport system substrate-binding protein
MRRRTFLAGLGSAAAASPLRAQAQSPKAPRIGVLVLGNPDPEVFYAQFRKALGELGYVDGQNIRFDFRSAGGRLEHLTDLAADLVREKVDLIVGWQTPTVTAASRATRDIPIVMAGVGDPLGTGLIQSLSRPGGTITGVSGAAGEVAGKNVELIKEMMPSAKVVAALCNARDPFAKPFLEYVQQAGRAVGLVIKPLMLSGGQEMESAFATLDKDPVDAVIIQPSLLSAGSAALPLKHKLPAVSPIIQFTESGGLLSYSGNLQHLYREAASYVDRILKGANPSDLPVTQPTKFEIAVNLKTARALGIEIPPTLLARADLVIE